MSKHEKKASKAGKQRLPNEFCVVCRYNPTANMPSACLIICGYLSMMTPLSLSKERLSNN